MIRLNILDDVNTNVMDNIVTTPENIKIAQKLNEQGVVLLKNDDNTLPLDQNKRQKLLILGEGEQAYYPTTHGTGSSDVWRTPDKVQSPLFEFCDRLGIKRFDNIDYQETKCSGLFHKNCITYGGSKTNFPIQIVEGTDYDHTFIFISGVMAGEDHERPMLGFSDETNSMISSFGKKNKKDGKKTIVVMSIPGEVTFPWKDDVDAIIADFYGGETMAPALLNVIYGDVNPSGKLPVSFYNTENDEGITQEQYPGVDSTSTYTEKLETGYRWFDAHDVEPLYPFGHGLSYTEFMYDCLKVNDRRVTVYVTNTGKRSGKEVVQLYVGFPEEAGEPPKLLKGFTKVEL